MESLICVENLCKDFVTYKRGSGFKESLKSFFHREKVLVQAVRNISFDVQRGDVIGILGPNGAGKSTTIKILAGTLHPTCGTVNVMGYIPWKDRVAYVQHIGAVFGQKSQLVFDIPPADSFRMNKAIYEIPDTDFQARLNRLVDLLDLKDKISRPTRVLSLGERMKCEFIMAMLHNPQIVFLDEPTIGLDILAKQNIRSFIREMNQQGTTFILTTHDLEDVERLARNVVVINHGSKVFENSLQNLKHHLGNKKIIELTLVNSELALDEAPGQILHPLLGNGAQLISTEKTKVRLEVDLDSWSINNFLAQVSTLLDFSDISIQELPMEEIVADLYRQSAEQGSDHHAGI